MWKLGVVLKNTVKIQALLTKKETKKTQNKNTIPPQKTPQNKNKNPQRYNESYIQNTPLFQRVFQFVEAPLQLIFWNSVKLCRWITLNVLYIIK